MKLNERHRLFIGEAVTACAEHGVTMTLSAIEKVSQPGEELGCSGFFLATERLFSVAMGKPVEEWFPVMLHEFGHMEQWLENPEQCVKDDERLDGLFWPWLEHKRELEPDQVRALTNLALSYELDCERRTAWRLHEEPELNISYSDYIKRANTYLYLYPLIAKYRKWCDQSPPYKVPELIAIAPDKFIGEAEDYWDVPEEIERLVVEKCFPKEDS